MKAIEIESYNNYKLMANGLITETITHELHSLSKTGITPDASKHFDFLKDYFVQSSSVRTYNDHVVPIKNSYSNISGKLDQIGNLYSFLETTFIKKGTYDEFIHENIKGVIMSIRKNLLTTVKKEKIEIICNADDLTWFVPKGVLLHVFYNLINNSLYWIDIRRKRAQSDRSYAHSGPDAIMIEEYGVDGIVVILALEFLRVWKISCLNHCSLVSHCLKVVVWDCILFESYWNLSVEKLSYLTSVMNPETDINFCLYPIPRRNCNGL